MSDPIITSAFVLAAGLGKRMRHLRDNHPKPLQAIAGVTLLDRVLNKVQDAGLQEAVVNVHYKAEMIEDALNNRSSKPNITVSDERGELLETGGGIKKALDKIPRESFFAINSDALWLDHEIDGVEEDTLKAMMATWDPDKMDVLLIMIPRAEAMFFTGTGDFFLDNDGLLTRRGEADTAPFVFGGIQIIKKSLFKDIKDNRFSLNKIYNLALQDGRAYGHYFKGLWMHIGDPEAVDGAEQYFKTLTD